MTTHRSGRALVLGAGMAGLLTARVLADRCAEVVLVERDEIVGVTGPRRGVPQGRHAHGLLMRGQQVLEELFPGFLAEITAHGVPSCDPTGGIRWYFHGLRARQPISGLVSVNALRPELEAHVRARVLDRPEVTLRQRTTVSGLLRSDDGERVRGARVADEHGVCEEIEADLVVDTTGRGSRIMHWLEELGRARPREEHVRIDLAYTSLMLGLGSDPFGDDHGINAVADPRSPRGAFFCRRPDGSALLSMTGVGGDVPPRERGEMIEFTRSLTAAEIHDAVAESRTVTTAVTFRVPASVRRHFEELSTPAGLYVLGDGLCAFNPVYGQGMTVAALEAVALGEHLDAGRQDPRDYYRSLDPLLDLAWQVSAGGDMAFPGVESDRTTLDRILGSYVDTMQRAASRDPRCARDFMRVAGMVDPPSALFRPGLVVRVLAYAARRLLTRVPAPA